MKKGWSEGKIYDKSCLPFPHTNICKDCYLTERVQEGENISLRTEHFKVMIPGCELQNDITINGDTKLVYTENHNSKTVQTDIMFENTIIERNLDKPKDIYHVYSRFKKAPYVVAGIPTERFNWIMKNAAKLHYYSLTCPEMYSSQNHTWVPVYMIPEVTHKEYIDCQIYKEDLKKAVPIGTVTKVLDSFKSNLIGYGQFTILITCENKLVFFLTGFQLIDTTTTQRFPQPEFKASPSDAVTEKLKKLSIHK